LLQAGEIENPQTKVQRVALFELAELADPAIPFVAFRRWTFVARFLLFGPLGFEIFEDQLR